MDGNPDHQRTEEKRLARARERVAQIKGFYAHLIIFVAVLVLLFAVDASTGGNWWVQWVFLGWGIGVLAHAFAIFGSAPGFISRWEERKVREYMDKQ